MSIADDHRKAWAKAKGGGRKQSPSTPVKRTMPKRSNIDAQFQVKLETDLLRLKSIKSHDQRDQVKRTELIPAYLNYLESVLKSNQGGQNDVIVQLMTWCIDAGPERFDLAFRLADFAISHRMATPENYSRDIQNVLAGTMASWCIDQLKLSKSPEPHATALYDHIQGWDLIDQIAAQIHRCQAEKYKATSAEKALEHAEKAWALDSRVGVKPLMNQLQKQLEEQADSVTKV